MAKTAVAKATTRKATVAKAHSTEATTAKAPTNRAEGARGAAVGSVEAFLATVDPARRSDCDALVRIMSKVTKAEPAMWGSSIVAFGSYHYKYASGREGDCALVSFSPRKKDLTIYLVDGVEAHAGALAKLGSPARGKGCVHFRSLEGLDLRILEVLIATSVTNLRKRSAANR